MPCSKFLPTRERGFALVVALLLMVALSLVGVAALRNVSLQERTAGNQYFRSIALNEARSVLRFVEQKYNNDFGVSTAGDIPTSVAGASSWSELDTSAAGTAIWAKKSTWTGKETASSVIVPGLEGRWTSDDMVGLNWTDPSCTAEISSACKFAVIRQTIRVDDPQTGAAVSIQQHYKYINKNDIVSP
jgi:Tfp pilus assembly protein PilX